MEPRAQQVTTADKRLEDITNSTPGDLSDSVTAAVASNGGEEKSKPLALAAELRNRIYETAFIESGFIKVDIGPHTTEAAQPVLKRTCRQVRGESLNMLYSLKTFRLCHENRTAAYALPSTPHILKLVGPYVHLIEYFELATCRHRNYY